ncbi:GDSL esterase/lipase At5g14450 [Euphorbia peplus]|nr:GDSL esterase/lipase At5g14450 [Euphorbia peplus]
MAKWRVLFTFWVLVLGVKVDALPPPCEFPAIYNFGDSNSDTGGISAAFDPTRPPNGEAFFHKPAGRASDGRLIIDFTAEKFKLPYLSAYLNSIGTNYRHGANFATGGSTIRRQNETIFEYGISPFSLDMQIVQFLQFKSRTEDLYTQVKNTPEAEKLPRTDEFAKALYTFDIGQNDLSVGFRKMSFDQLRATLPDIVNQLASAIQKLYKEGGSSNEMAVEFNTKLKDRVIKLRTEHPEAALTYVDVHAAKLELITKAKTLGLADPLKVCCGYHVNYDHVWCGNKGMVNKTEVYGAPCKDTSIFISWDGVHYTRAANQWIANHTQNGSLVDPPIPITHACHRQ